jgi:hypothetical protein
MNEIKQIASQMVWDDEASVVAQSGDDDADDMSNLMTTKVLGLGMGLG